MHLFPKVISDLVLHQTHPGNGQFVHRRCSMEREIDGFRCRSCWVKSKVYVVPEFVRGKFFFSFLPVPKNPRMSDDGLMNKDHAFKKACTKTYNLFTYRFSGLGNPGQNFCYGTKSDSIFRCSHPKFDLIALNYNRSQ